VLAQYFFLAALMHAARFLRLVSLSHALIAAASFRDVVGTLPESTFIWKVPVWPVLLCH